MNNDVTSETNSTISDVDIKTIGLRLSSVRDAMQRTRFVFLVMTIASSAILFTLWNDRFARDKDLAFDTPSYSKTVINPNSPEPLHVYGRKELIAEWYKNRIIQIGLLGIRLSVSDLSLIGSFTLVVITIWFYYSQRRENQAIVTLLRDVHQSHGDERGLAIRNMVYQGVKHSLVFIRTEESDKPLKGLEPDSGTLPKESLHEGEDADAAVIEPRTFTDRVLSFLSYLSFWAIVAIIVRDFSALFMKSPTSGTTDWLGLILVRQVKAGSIREFWNTFYPIFLIIVFDSFAIACAIYVRILCKRSRAFAEGTKTTLRLFESTLKSR